jgi:pimeloyl-ACP methyl ester carboxylesterase
MRYDRQGFITAPDLTPLFYGVTGAGADLILNDGIGCDGFAWRYLQPALARSRRITHWHYRGHGRSGAPQDPARLTIPDLASDLLAVMDGLSIDRAVLAGHSMGTQVALECYRQAPDRVQALVLICGSAGRVTQTFHGSDLLDQVLPSIIAAMEKRQRLARALWGRIPAALAFRAARLGGEVDGLAIREEDFKRYWEHVSLMNPDVFLPMLMRAGEHTAEDFLPEIRVPTLVIAAERDTFTPPELARRMAEMIPAAEHTLLRGGSHAAPIEQPSVIVDRIEQFLAGRIDRNDGVPSE